MLNVIIFTTVVLITYNIDKGPVFYIKNHTDCFVVLFSKFIVNLFMYIVTREFKYKYLPKIYRKSVFLSEIGCSVP